MTGAGSAWTNSAGLDVGYAGTGTLNIEAGGQVGNTVGYLGYLSTGTAIVDGDGSLWNNTGSLYVGGSANTAGGTGSVTVRNGGQLTVGGTLKIWNSGSLTIQSGGSLTTYSLINAGGTINWTSGTLGITGTGGFTVGSTGPLGASVTLDSGKTLNVTKTTTVASGGSLTLSGGALTTDTLTTSGGTISWTSGTWTFDEAIGGAGMFVKSGGGTLVIAGLQDYDPGAVFDVLGGAMVLDTDAGSQGADLSISVTGAELYFGCNQHLDTLSIGDGGTVVFAGASCVVLKHLVMDGVDFGATTLTPEPATLALVALGGLSLLHRRRPTRVMHADPPPSYVPGRVRVSVAFRVCAEERGAAEPRGTHPCPSTADGHDAANAAGVIQFNELCGRW